MDKIPLGQNPPDTRLGTSSVVEGVPVTHINQVCKLNHCVMSKQKLKDVPVTHINQVCKLNHCVMSKQKCIDYIEKQPSILGHFYYNLSNFFFFIVPCLIQKIKNPPTAPTV